MPRAGVPACGWPRPRWICLIAILVSALAFATKPLDSAQAAAAKVASAACSPIRYRSVPNLRPQRACLTGGTWTGHGEPGTYLFMTPGALGAGIFANNGGLIWWASVGGRGAYNLQVVHFKGKPYLAYWAYEAIHLYDEHYQPAGTITAGPGDGPWGIDAHEFQLTPQGDALVGVDDPIHMTIHGHRETVVQYVIQKLSLVRDSSGIHTGRVLFRWKSLSDVPLSQSHLPDPGAHGYWDYFHGNAIAQDSDGNLVVSSRNTWGIYKIDDIPGTPRYGHVIWQVGAEHDHTLGAPWCYQHDISALGHNTYSVFDNGGWGPGCVPGSTEHFARGLVFQVDPSKHPAGIHLLRVYIHNPPLYALYTGSVQRLADSDVLISWGTAPNVTEYSPSGQIQMDLTLSHHSYRALRFAWDGQPVALPAVSAAHQNGGTAVWASWNGSTRVRAWRVLAGPSSSRLVPVTGAISKTGFETAMFVNHSYATVAVQALNAWGSVLATSKAAAAK
jgi:hypothetical protein